MPARPLRLVPKEPKERPPNIPDGVWHFPRNLAECGNARGIGQQRLAEIAGVSQPTISRWLEYKGIESVPMQAVVRLEDGLKVPRGTLTKAPAAEHEPETLDELRVRSEARWAGRVSEHLTRLRELAIERLIRGGRSYSVAVRGAEAAMAYDPPRAGGEESASVDHLVELAEAIIESSPEPAAGALNVQTLNHEGVRITTDVSLREAKAAHRVVTRKPRKDDSEQSRPSNEPPRSNKKVR